MRYLIMILVLTGVLGPPALAQVSTAATSNTGQVPADEQIKRGGLQDVNLVFGQVDTAKFTVEEPVGNPLAYVITDTDSTLAGLNDNIQWACRVVGWAYRGYIKWVKIDRTVYQPTGTISDTAWVSGDSVYNVNPFGSGVDLILPTTVSVGDQFNLWWRTVVPLKVNSNRELVNNPVFGADDSLNTF